MLSPFEWWCRNFILPDICKPCLFVFLRNLFYLTPNPLALLATMKPLTKSPIRTYLGLDLLDRVPDHSTVSQLRWRKPSFGKSFRRLFEEIVRQCVPNGPVTGRLGYRLM